MTFLKKKKSSNMGTSLSYSTYTLHKIFIKSLRKHVLIHPLISFHYSCFAGPCELLNNIESLISVHDGLNLTHNSNDLLLSWPMIFRMYCVRTQMNMNIHNDAFSNGTIILKEKNKLNFYGPGVCGMPLIYDYFQ